MIISLGPNFRYSTHIKNLVKKINCRFKQNKVGKSQISNWQWIQDKPIPVVNVNRNLWRLSVSSFSFYFVLSLSAIIATLGLIGDSAAVIIGAMIIAPLMGPILGIAYSIAVGNRKLLRCSGSTVLWGIILTIAISWITASIIGLKTVDSEIISRINPTLIDFGIAMAAGTAGAFANTRRSISNTLPGVAIAIALVPPLSVVGIGLSLADRSIAADAFLLFSINLTCIVFFGSLVFLFQSYGNIERAKKGLVLSTALLFLLGFPLTLSMRELIIEKNVRSQIKKIIVNETKMFDYRQIKTTRIDPRQNLLKVEMQVTAPTDSISQAEINRLGDYLSDRIGTQISLRIEVIPLEILEYFEN